MMPHALSSLALAVNSLLPAQFPDLLASMNLPPQTRQLVVVTSAGWNDKAGELSRFEKDADGSWLPVGDSFPIVVGKNGMGWGRGLHQAGAGGPAKVEGDGKAPAGIFSLGTAFGYSDEAPAGVKWDYRACTARDFFVDDTRSAQYNQWVRLGAGENPSDRWASFERMRRTDALYEVGLVIEHNSAPAVAGKGSAIFFHVWRGPDQGTAGCTAMPKEQMTALLRWLEPGDKPLLIQAPREALAALGVPVVK